MFSNIALFLLSFVLLLSYMSMYIINPKVKLQIVLFKILCLLKKWREIRKHIFTQGFIFTHILTFSKMKSFSIPYKSCLPATNFLSLYLQISLFYLSFWRIVLWVRGFLTDIFFFLFRHFEYLILVSSGLLFSNDKPSSC